MRFALLIAAALVCGMSLSSPADEPAAGMPRTLSIQTGTPQGLGIVLAGRDADWQLLVTGHYADGRMKDLTRQAQYRVEPAGIAAVDATGLVIPLAEGRGTIIAEIAGGAAASTEVAVTRLVGDVPVSFPNQVTPLFTKLGCNGGGCHGKADGQNGFRLSLLGFEPQDDYEYVAREARGRRVFPAAPDRSLLLLKGTGEMPHGGGVRLAVQSPDYRVIRRWIEQGTRYGSPGDPVVERIEVFPQERLLERGASQQILIVAHQSDGTLRDITRLTQLSSNDEKMAEVSLSGLVTTRQLAGGVAVLARYQSHVDVFRGTVPRGAAVEALPAPLNFIDEHVFARLKKLGLPPSAVCDDSTFLRRVTIDLCGRLPTLDETEAFLAGREPNKYEVLIDRLLASDDYADYFANKWGAILRNRRSAATGDAAPTAAFHAWIRDSIRDNKPYDQFAREILTATGQEVQSPAVVWFRELQEPAQMLEDAAQLFLGQRIQCARCHHHPLEKWSQQDYYGLQAFFARIEVQQPVAAKKGKKNEPATVARPASVAFQPGIAEATNPRTGLAVKPTGLAGTALEIAPEEDPRARLADWMAEPENPFFARALVNRYWKHFFGVGLVDPEDDLRLTNPPSNPELLDALAEHFVQQRFDLKDLVRTLCRSQAYRLSAVPNAFNADDRQNASRFLPRRLGAEVLLDAIDAVTLNKTTFAGAADDLRAVQLPDSSFDSYFLSVFGRPDAASACECERSSDASLAQSLHLFNSEQILQKVSARNDDGTLKTTGRTAKLAADDRPHAERVRGLYLLALSREPTGAEAAALLAHIARKGDNPAAAYEDIIWALLNTTEFLYNH